MPSAFGLRRDRLGGRFWSDTSNKREPDKSRDSL
jgi:hypothetical protein